MATKPGTNLIEMERSGSEAILSLAKACTSLHLLPDASESRKAVFSVRCLRELSLMGSYGEPLKKERTRKRSQAGKKRGERASFKETPRMRSRRRGSSEKDLPPNCLIVVQIAAL